MRLIQILLGIATAIIVSLLAILGIKTFYPEPQQPARLIEMKPFPYRTFACEKGDAPCVERENEYYAEQQQAQEEENRARRDYEAALRVYNRGFFMAANVVHALTVSSRPSGMGRWTVIASGLVPHITRRYRPCGFTNPQ